MITTGSPDAGMRTISDPTAAHAPPSTSTTANDGVLATVPSVNRSSTIVELSGYGSPMALSQPDTDAESARPIAPSDLQGREKPAGTCRSEKFRTQCG